MEMQNSINKKGLQPLHIYNEDGIKVEVYKAKYADGMPPRYTAMPMHRERGFEE